LKNNQQICNTKEKKTKFSSKLAQLKINNNFITLDIETYIKDGILIPSCNSIYAGKNGIYIFNMRILIIMNKWF